MNIFPCNLRKKGKKVDMSHPSIWLVFTSILWLPILICCLSLGCSRTSTTCKDHRCVSSESLGATFAPPFTTKKNYPTIQHLPYSHLQKKIHHLQHTRL